MDNVPPPQPLAPPPPAPASAPPPPRTRRRPRLGRLRATLLTVGLLLYAVALAIAIADDLYDFGLFPSRYERMARDLIAQFDRADPAERKKAIDEFTSKIDQFLAVPELIRALDSHSPATRATAAGLLRDITGSNQAYDPAAPRAQRRAAIVRWRSWWHKHTYRF